MSNTKSRIWNNEELTFAYYVAKFGQLEKMKMTKDDVVYHIIGDTTERSFDMQVENFRNLLGLVDSPYNNYSQKMVEVSESLKNTTITNVRTILMDYAIKMDDVAEERRVKRANVSVSTKRQELNSELNKNFENKLAAMRKSGRRLTPVNK
mgnify:FL=1|tara:strand:+ start:283 stop:735 length:453 start_codon:yes stop_codon:yes gene_type:complete